MTTEFKSWDELSRKEQLEGTVWDMYKEAYGFRPRHLNLAAMTEAELEAECQHLQTEVERVELERREAEKGAVRDFEARIGEMINLGAKDRETALRWIHEADGSNGDDEYLCYLNGLPYGFFRAAA